MMDNVCLQFSETSDEAAWSINATTDSLRNRIDCIPKPFQPSHTPSNTPWDYHQPSPAPSVAISPFTYAAITKCALPALHASMLAKFDEWERQVIIDPAVSVNSTRDLGDLSELELLTKATTALEAINITDNSTPKDAQFVGIRKLAAGGILLP
jgi:hypothetical protein